MDEDLVKSSVVRKVFLSLITEVPFPEDAVFVACFLKSLGERYDIKGESLTGEDGVGNADLKGVTPAHKGGACWSAGRANLEVCEAGRFLVKGVNVGCF